MGLLAEPARLQEVRSYGVLDTLADARLDELAQAAALVCEVPVALVTLIDAERQYYLARVGTDAVGTPRKNSMCNLAIGSEALFEVPDATLDPRFATHPLVVADPHVRFFAAVPLVTAGRAAVGTLCVTDQKPGKLTARQGRLLTILARQSLDVLEQRKRMLQHTLVQQALDGQLRSHLEGVVRAVGKLQGSARDLTSAMISSDAALQTLDDAIDVLDERGAGLFRQPGDLAVACRDLVACYQLAGSPPRIFSATGDCRGSWDLDRLTRALDAFLERAEGPLRVSVRGLEDGVEVAVAAQSIAEAGLRVEAALQIIRAHGGSVAWTRKPGAVSLAVVLPR